LRELIGERCVGALFPPREFRLKARCVAALGFIAAASLLAAPARPNLLLAVADDWSWPHAGAYGCAWVKTPAFDRVAREGLLFRNAYTPNAKCAPSRACMLTGRNSWQLEEAANHMPFYPAKFKTSFETLAEHGYHVGHTAKGWGPGVVDDVNGRRRELTGPAYNRRTLTPPAHGISRHDYAANFRDFLEAKPSHAPFCFWYGSLEPHRGYEHGSGVARTGKRLSDVDRVYGFWPDNATVRTDLLDYAFEVEHFDRHLDLMLQLLRERGELQNTLVLVTADNGMPFPRVKGQAYEYSNHLPLAIMWPQGIRAPGRVVNELVSFIDFAPTFLELAGIPHQRSGMQPITGRSLTDVFASDGTSREKPARDFVLIGKERHDVGRPHDWGYPIRGLVTGGHLYLHNFETERWPAGNPETGYLNCDGSPTKTLCIQARRKPETRRFWQESFGQRPAEELYHLAQDPDCLTNLASVPDFAPLKSKLKDRLFHELKAQGDPRMAGQGRVFDDYIYSDAATRNFHARFLRGDKVRAGWVNESDFDPLDATEAPPGSATK
jgi:arylsulfatase A-like enzyme